MPKDISSIVASKEEIDSVLDTDLNEPIVEDEETGGSGSSPEDIDAIRILKEEGIDPDEEKEPVVEGDGTTPTTIKKDEPTGLTREEFLAGLEKMSRPAPVAQRQQEQPKLTDEQIRQQLKVWSMPKEWEKIFPEQEQRDALAALQAATVQQVMAAVNVVNQHTASTLRSEYQPALSFAQQTQVERFTKGFIDSYPGFEGIPAKFLDSVYQTNASSFKDKSTKEIYDILATEATKEIKALKPDFDPKVKTGKTTTTKQPTARAVKPATLSGGGQNGSGGSPNNPGTKKLNDGLWE